MRVSRIAGATVLALGLVIGSVSTVRAADNDEGKEIKGVLIDQHCADKMMKKDDPTKAAADHPKSCCLKCAKSDGALAIISDGKLMKLDDKSATMAMDYLKKDESKTNVVVEGKKTDDGKLSITSIKAAPEDKDKDSKKEG